MKYDRVFFTILRVTWKTRAKVQKLTLCGYFGMSVVQRSFLSVDKNQFPQRPESVNGVYFGKITNYIFNMEKIKWMSKPKLELSAKHAVPVLTHF